MTVVHVQDFLTRKRALYSCTPAVPNVPYKTLDFVWLPFKVKIGLFNINPKRKDKTMNLENIKWMLRYYASLIFGRSHSCKLCLADTRRIIRYNADSKLHYLEQPKNGTYCSRCVKDMRINCTWCGKAIEPGAPVTLYTPESDPPKGAVIYNHDPVQVVGCLRSGCARKSTDCTGYWIPPGRVRRIMPPMERIERTLSQPFPAETCSSDATEQSAAQAK